MITNEGNKGGGTSQYPAINPLARFAPASQQNWLQQKYAENPSGAPVTQTFKPNEPVIYSIPKFTGKAWQNTKVYWNPFDRNFEKSNSVNVPRYSSAEAMQLSPYGYTGVFGRSPTRQTLGLVGEEWQRNWALWQLRNNAKIPFFQLYNDAPANVKKDYAAASIVVPNGPKYNQILGLYTTFGDKYGANGEKYASRYGHLPQVGTKYGILFNTNNQKIRQADVNVTYQNNLVKASLGVAKQMSEWGRQTNNKALQALALSYAKYGDYTVKGTSSRFNPQKIKEMEDSLNISTLKGSVQSVLSQGQSNLGQTEFDKLTTTVSGGFLGEMLGTLAGVPALGAVIGSQLGANPEKNNPVNQALNYMNALSNSDALKANKVYWSNTNAPWYQQGLVGLSQNIVKGVARMGLGLPMGVGLMSDEAYLAGKETAKWASSGGKYQWGSSVDFKLGDAMWKDYSQRYYDTFAYDAKGNGRHWWQGLGDANSWARMGETFNNDPTAYILDAASIVPVIGWGAKAAGLASIGARTGSVFGKVGLTAEDAAALQVAKARAAEGAFAMHSPEEIANAQDLLNYLGGKPHLMDVVDEATLKEAGKIASDPIAQEELSAIQAKFDEAPSARTFRKTARAAYNGDVNAQNELSRWKAMGLEFNGAEKSWGVRAGAYFEPRTTVLAKPESLLEASPHAVYRMPASPFMRAAKNAYYWVGRGLDKTAIAASEKGGYTGKIGTKLIDMPYLSYRYNYTKAIRNTMTYNWGDAATEMQRAVTIAKIMNERDLPVEMQRAIENALMGGEGPVGLQHPAIQRAQIQDKIDALPRDAASGNVLPAAKQDLANLQKQLQELTNTQISDLQEASVAFDETYNKHLSDLKMRIGDPTYKADNVMLDHAVDVYRRLDKQRTAVYSRIAHEDTTFNNIEGLKLLYSEAMDGLRLGLRHLFGENGESGRIGAFRNRVLRVNTNMLTHGFADANDRASILALAQHPTDQGTVFDAIKDPALRKLREDQMVEAVKMLQSRHGIFTDGQGSYGSPGRPVLVKAKEKVGNDFVAFHVPTLRHEIVNGAVENGKIVDPNETFVLPKTFFAAKNKGLGAAILEDTNVAKRLLYEGALNAMSEIYPKARFYSEKLNDTGLRGVRSNEQMIATEHHVAESGMRQHALSRINQSMISFMRNRMERDLASLADSAAVLVPASQVVGKSATKSGYYVLANVREFFNPQDALDFARLRGVGKMAEKQLADYAAGNLQPVTNISDIAEGFGFRMDKGRPVFIVRGGTHDWLHEALQEDITTHSATKSWMDRTFVKPEELPQNGYVLAIPKKAHDQLAAMTIEHHDFATNLLSSNKFKAPTSLFKWFILNANPTFISNNVLGGLAMMMMYNPSAAPRILAAAIQKIARQKILTGIGADETAVQLAHFKTDSEAVSRQLAYENEHNIYRQDAGITDLAKEESWAKKYIWHGGYTAISAFEEMLRRTTAMDFLRRDTGFQSFMRGPEVRDYIKQGIDWHGNTRAGDEAITPFEAATDLLLDPSSPYYNAALKHRMRYMTNTVSGNYHSFTPAEQLLRNAIMPFYSWFRHSATFTWRMFVDKPIRTNAMYNLGQQGYFQNAEQGVPDWMMQTVPVPLAIKDMFGIKDSDLRIDANVVSPFGTTGDMARAAFKLLSGQDLKSNIFQFTNPYLNQVIQDTLGVNPQTGAIDWKRLQSGGNGTGYVGIAGNMGLNMLKATYPYKAFEVLKYQQYEQDALQNKYASVDNAEDIVASYDPNNPTKTWHLRIPKEKTTIAPDEVQKVFGLAGFRTYRLNPDKVPMPVRQDAVGAAVLKLANQDHIATQADRALKQVQNWQTKYDYVTKVWLPAARQQNTDPAIIQLVLMKIMNERPKNGLAKELLSITTGG